MSNHSQHCRTAIHHRSTATDVLRKHGFRATSHKLQLLDLLNTAGSPLSVQDILKIWQGTAPNQTTLYRALSDLQTAGVIKRIDLNSNVAHFEYTPDRPHHHHLVCTNCGLVEEIESCSIGSLEKKIIYESDKFISIDTHNLEFFGHCVGCSSTK